MRVEARGVGKRFGAVAALDDVCFEIPAGRRVALIGPNGSGKSTLNRILMGLLACEGEVRLDGRSPFRERVTIARRMAYVPQIAPQLRAPVGEVVRAVARVRGLAPAEVGRVAARLDLDLPALGATPVANLSGGTKQKLLISLALAARASLLVLDEPTGSLDAEARDRFFRLCDEVPSATTLLLCSHRLEEVRHLVDHVIALRDGRLVHDGPSEAFVDSATVCVIEVWVEPGVAPAWFEERGFRRAGGCWRLTTEPRGKLKLLAELTQALGPALRNVTVRDLERLDLSRLPGGARRD